VTRSASTTDGRSASPDTRTTASNGGGDSPVAAAPAKAVITLANPSLRGTSITDHADSKPRRRALSRRSDGGDGVAPANAHSKAVQPVSAGQTRPNANGRPGSVKASNGRTGKANGGSFKKNRGSGSGSDSPAAVAPRLAQPAQPAQQSRGRTKHRAGEGGDVAVSDDKENGQNPARTKTGVSKTRRKSGKKGLSAAVNNSGGDEPPVAAAKKAPSVFAPGTNGAMYTKTHVTGADGPTLARASSVVRVAQKKKKKNRRSTSLDRNHNVSPSKDVEDGGVRQLKDESRRRSSSLDRYAQRDTQRKPSGISRLRATSISHHEPVVPDEKPAILYSLPTADQVRSFAATKRCARRERFVELKNHTNVIGESPMRAH